VLTGVVKLAFRGADTNTDILATIRARMSVSVSVSASWNASFIRTRQSIVESSKRAVILSAPVRRQQAFTSLVSTELDSKLCIQFISPLMR